MKTNLINNLKTLANQSQSPGAAGAGSPTGME